MKVITKPEESLCDSCISAYTTGGSASFCDGVETYDCAQRYCSVLHIAIHFSGFAECARYMKKCGNKEEI